MHAAAQIACDKLAYLFGLVSLAINLTFNPRAKFEVCTFSRSRDIGGSLNLKSRSCDQGLAPLWPIFSKRELMFMFAICRRPSVCRLSVVCNVGAPYSSN